MPVTTQIFRVFVASPSDVREERDSLEAMIRDLNASIGKNLGVIIDLIRWETHVHPALGSDPQAIVNEQINDEYDIFIGILWQRFGTPTPRAASGTEEEFWRAYAKHNRDPNSVAVMIYFKEAGINPSNIDLDQIGKIQSFRKKIGDSAVYWTFQDIDEFIRLIRMHLLNVITSWGKKSRVEHAEFNGSEEKSENALEVKPEFEEEIGFLDLVEEGESGFEIVQEIAKRLAEHINDLSQSTNLATSEIKEIGDMSIPGNARKAKKSINTLSAKMEQFANRIDSEIPLLDDAFNRAISSIQSAAKILPDFSDDSLEHIPPVLKMLVSLKESLSDSMEGVNVFGKTIENQPRLTTNFNRAKRKAAAALKAVKQEFFSEIQLIEGAETLLTNIREKQT